MPDILDSYISKIDNSSISKKINNYILKIKLQKDRIIRLSTLQFETMIYYKNNYYPKYKLT